MRLFRHLFGSRPKPDSATPPTRKDAEAKADAERLLDALLPFAEQMLQQHGDFHPFGGSMAADGTITHEGAYTGTEHPPSQELIDLLRDAHRKSAGDLKLRACATVYDVLTVPPGRAAKQDAIAAAIDHVSGYSVVVMYPYGFDGARKLRIEPPFAVEGSHDVFPSPRKSTL